jgi:hypothetical protein
MRKNVYWIFHRGKYINKPFMNIDACLKYIKKNGLYDEYELNNNSDLEIVDRFGNSYNPDGTRYISRIEKDSRRIGLREGYNSDVISHYKKDYERIVDEVANDICSTDCLIILSNAIDGMDADSYDIAVILNLYKDSDEDIENLLLKPYRVSDIVRLPEVKYIDAQIEDIINHKKNRLSV